MIFQGIAPLFMERIPFWIRIIFITLSATGSFIVVRWAPTLVISLSGIVLASLSSGFGEITFMALSSFYDKSVVSLYSSGTGGAGIFGSLIYLALESWFNLPSHLILVICSPIPLLMGYAYFLLLERPDTKKLIREINTEEPEEPKKKFLSIGAKARLQLSLAKYSVPLFIVYFAEYLINQGIVPVVTFPNDPTFRTKEYVYYAFIYQVGVFISRSSVVLFRIKNLWCLAFWQVANAIFLFFAAYFNFVPSIWIIFGVILYEGLLGGAVYANAFYRMAEEIPEDIKEFCMSSVSFWYSCGILASASAGLGVQPWLKNNKK
eukprot:TRINITY_DN2241_c0_g1_i3.p1 TRINITY_DN2241_c0_g1~~TRINITY_DN2241_c0_g1_i3.p1  ORF type:complete len:320 (-),score=49.91 TRINITY_DN2241_c0_g1_i3:14-973(-)